MCRVIDENDQLAVIEIAERGENVRQRILDYMIKQPGTHFSAIRRDLGLSVGCLSFNIKVLEESKVQSNFVGCWKRFYPADTVIPSKKPLTPKEKEVISIIENNPGSSCKDLAVRLGIHRQAVWYHIWKLEKQEYIRKELDRGKFIFFMK